MNDGENLNTEPKTNHADNVLRDKPVEGLEQVNAEHTQAYEFDYGEQHPYEQSYSGEYHEQSDIGNYQQQHYQENYSQEYGEYNENYCEEYNEEYYQQSLGQYQGEQLYEYGDYHDYEQSRSIEKGSEIEQEPVASFVTKYPNRKVKLEPLPPISIPASPKWNEKSFAQVTNFQNYEITLPEPDSYKYTGMDLPSQEYLGSSETNVYTIDLPEPINHDHKMDLRQYGDHDQNQEDSSSQKQALRMYNEGTKSRIPALSVPSMTPQSSQTNRKFRHSSGDDEIHVYIQDEEIDDAFRSYPSGIEVGTNGLEALQQV